MFSSGASPFYKETVMARVIDPVCGMEIDTNQTAIQSKFEGQTYFFCSTTCAREFEANPREVLERHEIKDHR
jgi:Cu+-exporting ATPase